MKRATIKNIKEVVSIYYGLEEGEIDIKTNKPVISFPRQVSMHFSKIMTKHSLAKIGWHHGKKDHATVIHGCKSVQNAIDTSSVVRNDILAIETALAHLKPLNKELEEEAKRLDRQIELLQIEREKVKNQILNRINNEVEHSN